MRPRHIVGGAFGVRDNAPMGRDPADGPLWIDDAGVVRGTLPSGARTAADVRQFAEAARRLLGGKRARVLLDAREVQTAETEAWLSAIENAESFASAVAIVVSPTPPPELAAFQAQIDTFLLPCRLFPTVEAAEVWIAAIQPDPTIGD